LLNNQVWVCSPNNDELLELDFTGGNYKTSSLRKSTEAPVPNSKILLSHPHRYWELYILFFLRKGILKKTMSIKCSTKQRVSESKGETQWLGETLRSAHSVRLMD
jgi:hypothetical protein